MKFIYSLLFACISCVAFSQKTICPDVAGAVDHPLISKYKNSCIVAYDESKFNHVIFPASKIEYKKGSWKADKEITEEGKVTSIIYGIENTERATVLEVQRNYEQALKNGGFEIVYSAFGKKDIAGNSKIGRTYKIFANQEVLDNYQYTKTKSYFRFAFSSTAKNINADDAFFVARRKRDGRTYTFALLIHKNASSWEGLTDNIFIQAIIVEREDMETDQVSAASIDEKIKNEGKEVFHNILFDFGSDTLTQESYAIIETLSDYLKANPSQDYYIVGHTDNVGSLPTNQTLSEKRAKAVLNALTSKYNVPISQISAHGVGQLSPLSINTTEEGRALNRRVEIVLK